MGQTRDNHVYGTNHCLFYRMVRRRGLFVFVALISFARLVWELKIRNVDILHFSYCHQSSIYHEAQHDVLATAGVVDQRVIRDMVRYCTDQAGLGFHEVARTKPWICWDRISFFDFGFLPVRNRAAIFLLFDISEFLNITTSHWKEDEQNFGAFLRLSVDNVYGIVHGKPSAQILFAIRALDATAFSNVTTSFRSHFTRGVETDDLLGSAIFRPNSDVEIDISDYVKEHIRCRLSQLALRVTTISMPWGDDSAGVCGEQSSNQFRRPRILLKKLATTMDRDNSSSESPEHHSLPLFDLEAPLWSRNVNVPSSSSCALPAKLKIPAGEKNLLVRRDFADCQSSTRVFSTVENGVLMVNCPYTTSKPLYSLDPLRLAMSMFESYNFTWSPYLQPVRVDHVESITAWCAAFDFWGRLATQPRSDSELNIFVQHVPSSHVSQSRTAYQRYHPDSPRQDVVMLFVDSVSRANFIRSAPRTVSLLKEMHKAGGDASHQVLMFNRYNIVGRSTHGTMTPMWFDRNQWIWETAHENGGYTTVTAFEDCTPNSPHGGQTQRDYAAPEMYCNSWGDLWDSQRGPDGYCVGGRRRSAYMVDYARSFWRHPSHVNASRWMVMGFEEAHDPHPDALRQIDGALVNLLNIFADQSKIANSSSSSSSLDPTSTNANNSDSTMGDGGTFVFLLSDHGSRQDGFSQSDIGSLEVNLPLLSILVPNEFAQAHPQEFLALSKNQDRLVTAHDILVTLQFLAHRWNDSVIGPLAFERARRGSAREAKGINLFSEIPPTRTCEEAGIPLQFCACGWQPTQICPSAGVSVVDLANFAIDHMNHLILNASSLGSPSRCPILSLHSIRSHMLVHSGSAQRTDGTALHRDLYSVQFLVVPDAAVFKAEMEVWDHSSVQLTFLEQLTVYNIRYPCWDQRVPLFMCICAIPPEKT